MTAGLFNSTDTLTLNDYTAAAAAFAPPQTTRVANLDLKPSGGESLVLVVLMDRYYW